MSNEEHPQPPSINDVVERANVFEDIIRCYGTGADDNDEGEYLEDMIAREEAEHPINWSDEEKYDEKDINSDEEALEDNSLKPEDYQMELELIRNRNVSRDEQFERLTRWFEPDLIRKLEQDYKARASELEHLNLPLRNVRRDETFNEDINHTRDGLSISRSYSSSMNFSAHNPPMYQSPQIHPHYLQDPRQNNRFLSGVRPTLNMPMFPGSNFQFSPELSQMIHGSSLVNLRFVDISVANPNFHSTSNLYANTFKAPLPPQPLKYKSNSRNRAIEAPNSHNFTARTHSAPPPRREKLTNTTEVKRTESAHEVKSPKNLVESSNSDNQPNKKSLMKKPKPEKVFSQLSIASTSSDSSSRTPSCSRPEKQKKVSESMSFSSEKELVISCSDESDNDDEKSTISERKISKEIPKVVSSMSSKNKIDGSKEQQPISKKPSEKVVYSEPKSSRAKKQMNLKIKKQKSPKKPSKVVQEVKSDQSKNSRKKNSSKDNRKPNKPSLETEERREQKTMKNTKEIQPASLKTSGENDPEKSAEHPADLLKLSDLSTAGSSLSTDDDDLYFIGGKAHQKQRRMNHRVKKLEKRKNELRGIKKEEVKRGISSSTVGSPKIKMRRSDSSSDETYFEKYYKRQKDKTVPTKQKKSEKIKTIKKRIQIRDTDSSD